MNVLTISLMTSCNRSCYYCPIKKHLRSLNGEQTPEDIEKGTLKINQITNEALLKWLDKFSEVLNPVKWFIELTGGEPGLYPEINTLIPELNNRGFHGIIKTNGSLPIPKSKNFQLITAWHMGVEEIPPYYDQILIIKNPEDNWQKKIEYCEKNGIPYKTSLFDRMYEDKKINMVYAKPNHTIYTMHMTSAGQLGSCSWGHNYVPETIFMMTDVLPMRRLTDSCFNCKDKNDVEIWLTDDIKAKFKKDFDEVQNQFAGKVIFSSNT